MLQEEEIKLQIELIKKSSSLPSPPSTPRLLNLQGINLNKTKIELIQKFILSFQYNYTGQPFVKMNKSRGMSHISSVAKEIIRISLPIQCIEAVFLGCFLTAELNNIDRIPLSFKSKCNENSYRHIVLALRSENKWGAIGISRRTNLMYKEIEYNSLYDLIIEYKKSYAACGHRLVKIYIGLPFSHDVFCDMPIKWRVLKHPTYESDLPDLRIKLDIFSSNMLKMFEFFRREGMLPPDPKKKERIPPAIIHPPPHHPHHHSTSSMQSQKRCQSLPRPSRKKQSHSLNNRDRNRSENDNDLDVDIDTDVDKSFELNETNESLTERRRGRSKHRIAIDSSQNYEERRLSFSLTRNSTPSSVSSPSHTPSHELDSFQGL